jgi:uncharacterized protein (TIGR00730 family)
MKDSRIARKSVAVFGGRHPKSGDAEYEEALRLGALLAAANIDVISGGYSGVMEAVSRGAIEAGGKATGVTMEIFGSLPPNPFLTREIRTRDFFERLEVLATKPSGFIAVRGGMGTLTEMCLIWNMIQTGTAGDKPLILMGSFWRPLLTSIAGQLEVSERDLDLLHMVDNADEAIECLLHLIKPALGGPTALSGFRS